MEEKNKKTKFGRPRFNKNKLAEFTLKTFYLPKELDKAFDEFDRLSKKRYRDKYNMLFFPERCKSMLIRDLFLNYVSKTTDKNEIKQLILNYLKKEDERMKTLGNNQRRGTRKQTISV